jgi:hypothetical protein
MLLVDVSHPSEEDDVARRTGAGFLRSLAGSKRARRILNDPTLGKQKSTPGE